jgi:ketosteroid isomerase-like protein
MKEPGARILLAGLLLAGACRGRSEPEQPAAVEVAAAGAVDRLFTAALIAGNAEAIARLYDEDALLLPPEALPVRGREGIQGFWGGLLRSYDVHLTVGNDRFEIRGDRAYVVGHYRMETKPKSTEVPVLAPEDGKFLEVLKRQPDGSWSYLVDMYSANAPPK